MQVQRHRVTQSRHRHITDGWRERRPENTMHLSLVAGKGIKYKNSSHDLNKKSVHICPQLH